MYLITCHPKVFTDVKVLKLFLFAVRKIKNKNKQRTPDHSPKILIKAEEYLFIFLLAM